MAEEEGGVVEPQQHRVGLGGGQGAELQQQGVQLLAGDEGDALPAVAALQEHLGGRA